MPLAMIHGMEEQCDILSCLHTAKVMNETDFSQNYFSSFWFAPVPWPHSDPIFAAIEWETSHIYPPTDHHLVWLATDISCTYRLPE
jgi:hypothetical protein